VRTRNGEGVRCPARRQARVYRQDGTEAVLSETDALRGEDVLPGFSCAIVAILGR
jgi:Uma2 family endonuclease